MTDVIEKAKSMSAYLKKIYVSPEGNLRDLDSARHLDALIAHIESVAKREPLTQTRIGNYLRKCDNGDVSMYRNGFKDGVRFAEKQHNIGTKEQ